MQKNVIFLIIDQDFGKFNISLKNFYMNIFSIKLRISGIINNVGTPSTRGYVFCPQHKV